MGRHLAGFPVQWIVDHRRIEEGIVRCVWLLIPLQYYVLTCLYEGFAGGSGRPLADAYLPVAAMSVACVAAFFALSAVIALVYPRGLRAYEQRVRALSLAMIVTWGVTLALLSMSYSVGPLMGLSSNIVERLVYGTGKHSGLDVSWLAFVANFIWAFIAIALIIVVSLPWRLRRAGPRKNVADPNIFLVAIVNAIMMVVLHFGTFAYTSYFMT